MSLERIELARSGTGGTCGTGGTGGTCGTGGTNGTNGLLGLHASHRSHGSHRPAAIRARVAAALVLAFCAGLASGEAQPPRLCVEYVSGIVYEDEPITVCARVEAAGAPLAVRLTASLSDAAGNALASDAAEGTPAPSAPWHHTSTLAAGTGTPAVLTLSLAPVRRTADGAPLATTSLRVLNGREALPRLELQGTGLADAQGRHVVVRIDHRIRVVEQRWPLVRWVRRRIQGEGWTFGRVLVVGDDLGSPRDGYLAQLASPPAPWATSVLAVPSGERDGGFPVLRAVAALTAAQAATPDLAVLCLGWRDLDFGTDVLLFGRALELIVQQLEAQGCRQFVLVSPAGPGRSRSRLAPYREAVERVAFTYQARHLDLGGRMAEAHWLADPKDDRLVLRLPNAGGQRAIAEAITACLNQLRR